MARRTRFNTINVYTEVEVDVSDVLDELTKEDLIEECKKRKIPLAVETANPRGMDEELEDVLDMLKRGEVSEAIWLLDRLVHPKYRSLDLCLSALKASGITLPDEPATPRTSQHVTGERS